MRSRAFTVVGNTAVGVPVLAGVYRFFETHGLPLDVVLSVVKERGALPCWVSFVREALAAGMRFERALAKLDEAIADAYGPAFRDVVIGRLERLREAGAL